MFRTGLVRGAAALSILVAFAGEHVASAAARDVTAIDPSQCSAIARTVGQAVGIALRTTVGKPDLPGTRGIACVMSGHATGLTLEFEKVRQKLEASLTRAGWNAVSDFDADGPDSTLKGFAKASRRVVYALSTEPPSGTCENVPVADCQVPRRRWIWTLTLSAFVQ